LRRGWSLFGPLWLVDGLCASTVECGDQFFLSIAEYDAAIIDPRNRVQIAQLRWFADYPTASGFISNLIFDCTYFCDED
jgi:hypothetical protein